VDNAGVRSACATQAIPSLALDWALAPRLLAKLR
jgi:hypothetical protein